MTSPSAANPSHVAAIVAAYNEEPTIGGVVQALVSSGVFREVIVVSDGSTDRTAELARAAGATLVHQLPWKHGKGAAMQHGVTHTDAPILFFCDADLFGLRKEHLVSLVEPVRSGELAMCVGLRDRGRFVMRLTRFLPLIGGERAVQRQIFERIPEHYLQGFMVEIAMNAYCKSHRLRVGTRECPGLHIRRKMQKVGWWKGLKEYIRMWRAVLKAMWITRLARLKGEL